MRSIAGTRISAVLGTLLGLGLLLPAASSGQEREHQEVRVDVLDVPPGSNYEPLDVSQSTSPFDLNAIGDEGAAGVLSAGSNIWCIQNITAFASRNNVGCNTGFYTLAGGFRLPNWFDTGMVWGAPASDMPEEVNRDALVGLGYTVNMTTLIIGGFVSGGGDKLWASDRSAAELLNLGVTGTEDGTCTDHSADKAGHMDAGAQLTPTSDCPATYPPTGWGGRHPIEGEAYLELQASDPAFAPSADSDPFAFWRVPEEMQQTDQFFGNWQTYGELTDAWLEALGRYGGVIPGGSGDPVYGGWPLGLTMFYDAFYFSLPTVANAQYLQATIVNNSERVYGVGVEYDSVYIGINYDPLQCNTSGSCPQADAHFFDPDRNAVTFYDGGSCPNAPASPSNCPGLGFAAGEVPSGFVILKSPIGDMRNELFSDPGSDFYDPSHPRAGDTITLNNQHNCGFGGCIPNTWSWSLRSHFGLLSSTGENVLDGRTPGDMDDADYWLIFRSEDWPERNGEFNKYVPGVSDNNPVWDWNHDGVPDTIYSDACGSNGCVAMWGDTLPGGHANRYGNISEMAVGPVHMAPNDTVGFVVAVVAAPDSAGMERTINNAIDFYKNFYLGPSAATPPRIGGSGGAAGGVSVVPGEQGTAQVQLFFDDSPEQARDPFFDKLIQSLTPEQLQLNPWLPDSIRARQANNLAAIHVFKSCDGGSSFTADSDCDGDPINDATSKWAGFGWQPYRTIEADAAGTVPNTFTDTNVQPGVTVTYSIVTETRGMKFNIVTQGDDGLRAQQVEFAPALLSGLTTSSGSPNVAVVYVPLNLAAGARLAESSEVSKTGRFTVPVGVDVVRTAPSGGQYRVVFADSIEVIQEETLNAAGEVESTNTSVVGMEVVTVTNADGEDESAVTDRFEFQKSGTIAMSGITQAGAPETSGNVRTTRFGSDDFGLIVARGSTPLMASTTLGGTDATPGTFFGQPDFPFFVVDVDASDGGTFNSQTFVGPGGETIPGRTAPSVQWLTSGSSASSALDASEFGTYHLSWTDAPFPGAPYNIGSAGVTDIVQNALSGRGSSSSTSTDPDLLAAVKEADASVTTSADDLEALSLPFTIRNDTYDRSVTVVATRHQSSILIGAGADTLRLDVPDGVWVPGDVLYAVETVTRPVRDENGNVTLGGDGQPVTETVPAATFKVGLQCAVPRASCDPTVGGRDVTGYSVLRPGTEQFVDYYVPFKAGDEYVFEVRPALSAAEATDISLEGVHVVPNPYLAHNKFERGGGALLKFTSLPPEGRIRIFDVAGRFIQQIVYEPDDLQGGDLNWDLTTRENLQLAAGLYIFVLETPDGDRKLGKFVVIR